MTKKEISETFKKIDKSGNGSFSEWMRKANSGLEPNQDVWIVSDTTSSFSLSEHNYV